MREERVIFQHGDVVLYEAKSIPSTAKQIKVTEGFVVEKGEGVHTHTLENVEGVEGYVDNGILYLKVKTETRINHEEHGPKTMKPRIYFKEIENEFDYETEESRKTRD